MKTYYENITQKRLKQLAHWLETNFQIGLELRVVRDHFCTPYQNLRYVEIFLWGDNEGISITKYKSNSDQFNEKTNLQLENQYLLVLDGLQMKNRFFENQTFLIEYTVYLSEYTVLSKYLKCLYFLIKIVVKKIRITSFYIITN